MSKSIFFITLILFTACTSGVNRTVKNENEIENYKSYVDKQGEFDNNRFLRDNSGTWVCYKFHKDTIDDYSGNSNFDLSEAKELSDYFYFKITDDTIIANGVFKMPIYAYSRGKESLSYGEGKYINMLSQSQLDSSVQNYYFIRPIDNLQYCEYQERLMKKGDVLPIFGFTRPYKRFAPFSGLFANYDNQFITSYNSFLYYFRKGEPYKDNLKDTGIPSLTDNRFVVNRTYENCSIKEAAYKLIEEFPKGTESLLIADDDPGESAEQELSFPTTSFELYSTVYKWEGQDKLTIRVGKNSNCTFVFEFNKQGNNVSVKYWNDVVFPFEKGYCSYN